MRSSNLPERSASRVNAFCLVLLRMGFSLLRTVTSRTVRSYRTFSPLPVPSRQPFAPCLPCHTHDLGISFCNGTKGWRESWPSAVLLSVPLSVVLPRPAVSRHSALWSPDFPPRKPYALRGDCLSGLYAEMIITQGRLKLGISSFRRPCLI